MLPQVISHCKVEDGLGLIYFKAEIGERISGIDRELLDSIPDRDSDEKSESTCPKEGFPTVSDPGRRQGVRARCRRRPWVP